MRTPKEIFDEELSGEPLTEESVIEALKMYWNEAIDECAGEMSDEILIWSDPHDYSCGVDREDNFEKQEVLKLKIK